MEYRSRPHGTRARLNPKALDKVQKRARGLGGSRA